MNTKLLRQKILDLAIRGKLTEQKKTDGTTKDLLAQIQDERRETKDERDAGKKDSSNVILERTSNVIASEAKQSKKSKPAEPKTIIPLNKDEAPFEIPENWEWVKIGDLFNLQAGKFIPADKIYPEATDNLYPCYGGNGLRGYVESYNRIGKYPLIGRQGALCGNINFASGHFYATEHAIVVETPEKLDVSWACYFLKQLNLNQYASSTAQPGLSVTKINEVEIPLPPLAEQKRIVEAIESAFAEITAIENNQELLKKHIKQGRQKILDLAIRGKLTEQKESDGTTKDLLTQISSNVIASEAKQSKKSKPAEPKTIIPLNKDEAPFEIPTTWEWVSMENICSQMLDGDWIESKDQSHEGIRLIQTGNIGFGKFKDKEGKYHYISESTFEKLGCTEIFPGDILISRLPEPVGRSCMIPQSSYRMITAVDCTIVRVNQNCILPECFLAYTQSNCYLSFVSALCAGTTRKRISRNNLSQVLFPLPPLAEQQRIVAAIESAFTEFDAMEKNIKWKNAV